MATYLDLQDEVLAHGFDAGTYRARVKTWLNEAQSLIARRLQIRDLLTSTTVSTTSGTSVYALPSVFVRANGLVDEDYPRRLGFVEDPDGLLETNENGLNTGRPEEYSLTASGLLLSPVPDGAYDLTLEYWSRPTDMSADADESALPSDWHFVMVSYALSRAYRSEDDPQMSSFFWNEFLRDMGYMASDLQFQARDAPRQVPGTWEDI
jgi:hypothetical protein